VLIYWLNKLIQLESKAQCACKHTHSCR